MRVRPAPIFSNALVSHRHRPLWLSSVDLTYRVQAHEILVRSRHRPRLQLFIRSQVMPRLPSPDVPQSPSTWVGLGIDDVAVKLGGAIRGGFRLPSSSAHLVCQSPTCDDCGQSDARISICNGEVFKSPADLYIRTKCTTIQSSFSYTALQLQVNGVVRCLQLDAGTRLKFPDWCTLYIHLPCFHSSYSPATPVLSLCVRSIIGQYDEGTRSWTRGSRPESQRKVTSHDQRHSSHGRYR